jgi:hypothetical protein
MIPITKELVLELREKTTAGIMECKRALIACNGDLNKAIKYLKHYPFNILDIWRTNKYSFCSKCDRYYVISKNAKHCNQCNEILED